MPWVEDYELAEKRDQCLAALERALNQVAFAGQQAGTIVGATDSIVGRGYSYGDILARDIAESKATILRGQVLIESAISRLRQLSTIKWVDEE